MKVELMALLQGIAESRATWKVVWQVSLSVAALSFVGLGWLIGKGALVALERPRLSPLAFLLFWVGLGSGVLGLVAALLSK